jgi:hypothetical protein
MAKRKLSSDQRLSLRKEMRKLVSQGKKQADILKAIASKYGITTITARWYYKGVTKPGRKPAAVKVKTKRRRKSLAGRPRLQAVSSAGLRVVHQVQSIAEKSFRRVLEVRKLIPKWQVYVKKEASLRKLEGKVKTQLRAISSKASAIHRKIRALTSN